MPLPNEPVFLLIDSLPLRSLGFISAINRLNHFNGGPAPASVPLDTTDETGSWIDAHAGCEMLIYIAGGACNAECGNLERIKALKTVAPDMPLMIFSDGESREKIMSTLSSGAQGFVCVDANAELALRALSFMLDHGSFFPPAMRRKHNDLERLPATDGIPASSYVSNGDDEVAQNPDCAAKNRSFTERQKRVSNPLLAATLKGPTGLQ